ncbi:hypothetical protein CFC21_023662 [Triticum aestivum]|uniref:Protein EARLY HEADING DATE 2 n=2 Tax=Triticum aestivum TaxID=4565 RepID=A0A3B6C988_WHEAT|nr:zinc finger protein GAI-ASSOCIATED FACTOR 1-like [Triticum aestivum]KAF7009045.1 hypothetical protein CFC21_023662 [Triticum aestivum]
MLKSALSSLRVHSQHQKLSYQTMSQTSEEESLFNFQQQQKLALCEAALSKSDPIIHAGKKRRGHPGQPDPDAEVVAFSPKTLLATNRYICEVCHKGFQRDQNLQLHRRCHNLPWKLKQTSGTDAKKKVYICPEATCPHHDATRALGDLTGIKKHYSRKHGEKKWKCERCSKKYAVQSDWRAHTKICGTKEYRCDCGTIFSRKDSFITHRAFCDALTEDNSRINQSLAAMVGSLHGQQQSIFPHTIPGADSSPTDAAGNFSGNDQSSDDHLGSLSPYTFIRRSTSLFSNQMILPHDSGTLADGSEPSSTYMSMSSPYMSATALLQKAAEMGAKTSEDPTTPLLLKGFPNYFTTKGHIGISSGILGTPIANSDRKKTAEDNSSYMNSPWTGSCMRPPNAVPWIGLPPFSMGAENRSSSMVDEDHMQQNAHETIFGVRDVGLTQDFLGLGGHGNAEMHDDTYNGEMALSYSNEQQKSEQDIYSYHQ